MPKVDFPGPIIPSLLKSAASVGIGSNSSPQRLTSLSSDAHLGYSPSRENPAGVADRDATMGPLPISSSISDNARGGWQSKLARDRAGMTSPPRERSRAPQGPLLVAMPSVGLSPSHESDQFSASMTNGERPQKSSLEGRPERSHNSYRPDHEALRELLGDSFPTHSSSGEDASELPTPESADSDRVFVLSGDARSSGRSNTKFSPNSVEHELSINPAPSAQRQASLSHRNPVLIRDEYSAKFSAHTSALPRES
jgi:hypothetical protein